jgi:glutamate racemase
MGEGVTLVSSDTETANDVYRVLVGEGLERTAAGAPSIRYEATGVDADDFLHLAHLFMGPEIASVDLVRTGTLDLGAIAAQSGGKIV